MQLLERVHHGHHGLDKPSPCARCVPKLPLRHRTPGRMAHSAVLFVGSSPATHKDLRGLGDLEHLPTDALCLGHATGLPAVSHCATVHQSGRIATRHWVCVIQPSRTRCHAWHICRACSRRPSPISCYRPPRSLMHEYFFCSHENYELFFCKRMRDILGER
jgi:hypothetical protein